MSAPSLQLPRCPHCSGKLEQLNMHNWIFEQAIVVAAFCPHQECSKVLHMSAMPIVAQPQNRHLD